MRSHKINGHQCAKTSVEMESAGSQRRTIPGNSWSLKKKAFDLISVFMLVARMRSQGIKIIWAFANVAGAIAWFYSRAFNLKLIVYSYEPHARFMVELGQWKEKSTKFKLLDFLEHKVAKDASFVLTGTRYMQEILLQQQLNGKVFYAPTGVDQKDFFFRQLAPANIRLKHGISASEKIVLYLGKFGGLYYTHEVFSLFRVLESSIRNLKFIVVTSNPVQEIQSFCKVAKFDFSRLIYLSNITSESVKDYMSAADIGISAVPPTPSQRFRSPTKVGEYLLCGLPFITCKGVSEDDLIANEHNVGVVVDRFSSESVQDKIGEILQIFNTDRAIMINRCRTAGLQHRSKAYVDSILKSIFDQI
jgi:hypothetical protein